jgi:hypothetical protein
MASPEDTKTEDQVRGRARLLPEEEAAGGSADPEAMAREVLESSEERVQAPHDPPDSDEPDNVQTR